MDTDLFKVNKNKIKIILKFLLAASGNIMKVRLFTGFVFRLRDYLQA